MWLEYGLLNTNLLLLIGWGAGAPNSEHAVGCKADNLFMKT